MSISLILVAMSCLPGFTPPEVETRLHRQMRYLMGTLCEIRVYDTNSERAERAIRMAFEDMNEVERLLSNYNPNSPLSVLNREAAQAPVPLSVELYSFLRCAESLYRRTEGAFDPTVGPLVRAWGFLGYQPHVPTALEIDSARRKVGFDKIRFDDASFSVQFSVPGMEIDSGGIGKGYAVDRAAARLIEQGITSALINTGSSTFYAIGKPPGRDCWWIGIKDPLNPERALAFAQLEGSSLSTSGNLEKFVQMGNRKYGHIFDPRSGMPAEGVYQVSIVAPTATESDALTKAAFVLPRSSAFSIFHKLSGTHCLRVDAAGNQTRIAITPWSRRIFRKE